MPNNKEEYPKKENNKNEQYGQIFRSINDFLQERPVKGFLQTMDDFFRNPFPATAFDAELKETDKEHVILAALPGVKKEQITIDILGNNLSVTVKKEQLVSENDEKNHFFRHQQWKESNTRTFSLPYAINEKKVTATHKNGLLEIRIVKQKGKNILIED